jgi:hypothetical protein
MNVSAGKKCTESGPPSILLFVWFVVKIPYPRFFLTVPKNLADILIPGGNSSHKSDGAQSMTSRRIVFFFVPKGVIPCPSGKPNRGFQRFPSSTLMAFLPILIQGSHDDEKISHLYRFKPG